jgi:hypothetical protein
MIIPIKPNINGEFVATFVISFILLLGHLKLIIGLFRRFSGTFYFSILIESC